MSKCGGLLLLAVVAIVSGLIGCHHEPRVFPPASSYQGPLKYMLAYVDPSQQVVVRSPWYGDIEGVGRTTVDCRPSFGCFELGGVERWFRLLLLTPERSLVYYKSPPNELVLIPVEMRPGSNPSPHWAPSGTMLALEYMGDSGGTLDIIDPDTGGKYASVGYESAWSWSPSGHWIAVGVRRGDGSQDPCDLGLVDAPTGAMQVLVEAKPGETLQPLGWGLDDACLAYVDQASGQVRWVDPYTSEPCVPGQIPLSCNGARLREMIPQSLASSWTGEYAISPGDALVAIVCDEEEGPTIYVGVVSTGAWYLVGPGDRTSWSPYPENGS